MGETSGTARKAVLCCDSNEATLLSLEHPTARPGTRPALQSFLTNSILVEKIRKIKSLEIIKPVSPHYTWIRRRRRMRPSRRARSTRPSHSVRASFCAVILRLAPTKFHTLYALRFRSGGRPMEMLFDSIIRNDRK